MGLTSAGLAVARDPAGAVAHPLADLLGGNARSVRAADSSTYAVTLVRWNVVDEGR